MSYQTLILPNGVTWGYKKSAKFQTTVQTPRSGRGQVRYSVQSTPIYEWELTWDYLKEAGAGGGKGLTTANDFQYLQDFYLAMNGSYGGFVFDPSQSNFERLTVTSDLTQYSNGFSGVGDGVTTGFLLWRSSALFGTGSNSTQLELIQNAAGLTGIYINGVLQTSGYTQTNFPAQVVFNTPPAPGAVISWAGSYNYVVHFADDTADLDQFMLKLWALKSLKLEAVIL